MMRPPSLTLSSGFLICTESVSKMEKTLLRMAQGKLSRDRAQTARTAGLPWLITRVVALAQQRAA